MEKDGMRLSWGLSLGVAGSARIHRGERNPQNRSVAGAGEPRIPDGAVGFHPWSTGIRLHPLLGAKCRGPIHHPRCRVSQAPAHAVPCAAQVKPTDVSNYDPIWRLPGPANFWARQRRNNRSIVRFYVTAPIPTIPGTLPGPFPAQNAAPSPWGRAMRVPNPEPLAVPMLSPANPQPRVPKHPPPHTLEVDGGPEGRVPGLGGMSPSSLPSAPPAARQRQRPSRRSCWRIIGSGGSS